ncbi:hypothetical protein ACFQ3W_09870 [Paenibacillus puldeungensis]|uniref:Heparinase II/III-like protein n=1 Tax=Paenibacillus puldeungensis TaxID=696536 RepID=A0ABW3RXL4_9BACL
MKPVDAHLYYPGGDSNLFWQTVRESPAYAQDLNEIRAEGERLLQNRIPELSYSLFSIFGKTGSRMEYENGAHAFRNLLWRDRINFIETKEDWGPTSFYLPDAKWMVSRHLSPEGVYGFCAKGGHNGEPHNHNDIGQFMLAFNGETFVTDLGSGEYNADYFGTGRYRFDCNGSQGHSVPIVDGNFQAEGERHAAVVLEAVPGESLDVLRLDLTAAYDCPGLKTLTRSLIWNKTDLPILELRDEYQFSFLPQRLVERIVTKLEPSTAMQGELILAGDALAFLQ